MSRPEPQSALRYPLTRILRAEANVRVLRELVRHGGELSAPSVAMRTGLSRSSVHQTLGSLAAVGIAEAIGSGKVVLHRLRRGHPLAPAVERLFEAEEERFTAILVALRDAAEGCGDEVMAVWLYGSVARGADDAGSDVDIAVVVKAGTAAQVEETMRDRLREAEDALGFSASIVVVDTSDIVRLAAEADPWWKAVSGDARPISGAAPDALLSRLRRGGRAVA